MVFWGVEMVDIILEKNNSDIFDRENIIGPSTITILGTVRIVASKDADHEYHFLVMTVKHREKFTELTPEELSDMQKAERIIERFYKKHGINGYSKIELVGEEAGRTVAHYHVHFIPLKSDLFHNNPKDRGIHRDQEQMNKIVKELIVEFKSI
ncbi:MAG: HIT domain-containing protein, partial [Candidatus Micrarchaeaceae archaeon]